MVPSWSLDSGAAEALLPPSKDAEFVIIGPCVVDSPCTMAGADDTWSEKLLGYFIWFREG